MNQFINSRLSIGDIQSGKILLRELSLTKKLPWEMWDYHTLVWYYHTLVWYYHTLVWVYHSLVRVYRNLVGLS